ncbi:MAG: hypothetical protein PHX41_04820 [Kiritimatiellae bacterium]|nr:hypothetical protein [Kiritimatiellia bacterium]
MRPLTESEKKELVRRVTAGETLPASWQKRLFPDSGRAEPVGKEYRLVYEGKLKREEVLAQTTTWVPGDFRTQPEVDACVQASRETERLLDLGL